MTRDEMVRYVRLILSTHEPVREWGGLRAEAEEIVDDYLRSEDRRKGAA